MKTSTKMVLVVIPGWLLIVGAIYLWRLVRQYERVFR